MRICAGGEGALSVMSVAIDRSSADHSPSVGSPCLIRIGVIEQRIRDAIRRFPSGRLRHPPSSDVARLSPVSLPPAYHLRAPTKALCSLTCAALV